jgi:hypothetical protein
MLIAVGVDPPKIHNLRRLAGMLDPTIQDHMASVNLGSLNRWAIEGRYPADLAEATAQDATEALRDAGTVLNVITATVFERAETQSSISNSSQGSIGPERSAGGSGGPSQPPKSPPVVDETF